MPEVRAALDAERLVLVPGQAATVGVQVTNGLEVIDGITASYDVGEGLRVTSEPQILLLFPDGSGVLTLSLTASPTFTAGIHQAVVEVRSRVEPTVLRLPLELEVTPAPAAVLSVTPTTRTDRTRGSYTVVCENRGNTTVALSLAASDSARVVVPDFEPPLVSVEPGRTASTLMTVATRRQWFGSSTRRQISILGTSNDLELGAQATFVQKPMIARGVRTALVLGLVVAAWALVFLFALNRALANDALTKEVPASFYAADVHIVPGSAVPVSALRADLVGLTSGESFANAPPGAVPKSGVVIGVGGTINGTVDARSTMSGIGRIAVQAVRVSTSGPCSEKSGQTLQPSQLQRCLVASAASASNGSYSIAGLLPGEYMLRFTAQGYTDVWWPQATSSSQARPIPVAAMLATSHVDTTITGLDASLTGTVDTGQTPAPPVQVTITMEQGGSAQTQAFQTTATSNAQGNYSIPRILPAPASYDLSFTSPGYLVASDVEEVAGGGAQVANTVTLTAGNGTLGGSVTDGTNPLGGVTITASANGRTVTSATPTSGAVGRFTIPNLTTPSTYLLTFTKPGYGSKTLAVNVGPGQSVTNLSIVMQGGAGQVSGTVSDAAGNPLGGVTVTVNGASGTASSQTLTAGAVGTYLVSGLATPAGYTVTFSLTGYISQTLAAQLSSNGSVSGLDVTLPLNVGTIRGSVVSSSGSPLSGVQVSITNGTSIVTTQTASLPPGGFTVTGLAPSSYALTFSLAGYENQTALVRLSPGASQSVPITLQPVG
jgi:hypothetical protein